MTSIIFLPDLRTHSVFLFARWWTFNFLSTSYHYLSSVHNFGCRQHGPLPGVGSDRSHCGVSHRDPPVGCHHHRWSHSFHEASQKTKRYLKNHIFNWISFNYTIYIVIGKESYFHMNHLLIFTFNEYFVYIFRKVIVFMLLHV